MYTREKYKELPEEYQRECCATFETMKRHNDCRPDEWEHIVEYFFEEYKRPAQGWFQWWDE